MATRKNVGVRMGRPPMTAAARMPAPHKPKMATGAGPSMNSSVPMGAAPSDGFAPGLPAAGFSRGGRAGYGAMPHHHDDPDHNASECNGYRNFKKGGCT